LWIRAPVYPGLYCNNREGHALSFADDHVHRIVVESLVSVCIALQAGVNLLDYRLDKDPDVGYLFTPYLQSPLITALSHRVASYGEGPEGLPWYPQSAERGGIANLQFCGTRLWHADARTAARLA